MTLEDRLQECREQQRDLLQRANAGEPGAAALYVNACHEEARIRTEMIAGAYNELARVTREHVETLLADEEERSHDRSEED